MVIFYCSSSGVIGARYVALHCEGKGIDKLKDGTLTVSDLVNMIYEIQNRITVFSEEMHYYQFISAHFTFS